MAPVVEEGAKGSASSAERHPILPPPSANVRLDAQLQPSSDEGGTSTAAGPSGTSGPSANAAAGEFVVPPELAEGVPMLKVSAKKVQQRTFRLDADKGTLEWESKRGGTSTSTVPLRAPVALHVPPVVLTAAVLSTCARPSQHREHPRAALHRLGAVVHSDV